MPEEVKTKADFDQCLKDNQKVVVDFTASWCGPCKMIGPKFAAMESEYPTLKFIKVCLSRREVQWCRHATEAQPNPPLVCFRLMLTITPKLLSGRRSKLCQPSSVTLMARRPTPSLQPTQQS